jgi:hypothetical protein
MDIVKTTSIWRDDISGADRVTVHYRADVGVAWPEVGLRGCLDVSVFWGRLSEEWLIAWSARLNGGAERPNHYEYLEEANGTRLEGVDKSGTYFPAVLEKANGLAEYLKGRLALHYEAALEREVARATVLAPVPTEAEALLF